MTNEQADAFERETNARLEQFEIEMPEVINLEYFYNRLVAYYGRSYPIAQVTEWYKQYQNENMHGKFTSDYDFIVGLQLNDKGE